VQHERERREIHSGFRSGKVKERRYLEDQGVETSVTSN
jgi:hypothetical protein